MQFPRVIYSNILDYTSNSEDPKKSTLTSSLMCPLFSMEFILHQHKKNFYFKLTNKFNFQKITTNLNNVHLWVNLVISFALYQY